MPSSYHISHINLLLLLLILPFTSAEAFSPSSNHHRSINISRYPNLKEALGVASAPQEHRQPAVPTAFQSSVSTTAAEDMSTTKKDQYSWTKPTLELAIPALIASIAGWYEKENNSLRYVIRSQHGDI